MSGGAGATVQWVRVGRPAARALAAAIDEAKGGDPLAPVTVAVPSVFAGLGLRRALAVAAGGLVNVRFLVLARVAELLGAARLAARGKRPLTRAVRAEAVRAALAADPGPFGDVALHPATVRSVDRAVAELRRSGGATGHLGRVVARVAEATADWYDDHDLLASAAALLRASPDVAPDVGHVVLHLPRRVSTGEQALLDALADAGRLTVLLGVGDEPSRRIGERLGATLSPDEAVATPPAHILVAPDPEVEVRAVVRRIGEWLAEGRPLHRIGIVYPSPRPYGLIVHEQLAAAGIPHSGPAVRTLAHTAAGRVLLGLLRLPSERFSRAAVTAWLSSGPVLETAGGERAPAPRWDALSRAIGVVGGEAQWRDALGRHRWALGHRLQRLEAEGEDDSIVRGLRAELDHVDRLDAFVAELVANASPPLRASWTACAAWGRRMLARYLGGEGRRDPWPDDELEAARAVESALDGLAALDRVSGPPDAAAFALVFEEQLRAPFGRQGRFGTGVFVGRVADAACLDLDALFVLGLAEGVVPQRRAPDPLLPDDDVALRRAEERRDFLWAQAAADECVLSFAVADQRGRRERLPSRWLLDAASTAAGRRLYADDLAAHPPAPWLDRVVSFPAVLRFGDEAGSPQELRLRSLLDWTGAGGRAADHPMAPAGIEVVTARRADRLTRWTGLVGPIAREAAVFEGVQSATALQTWATCPRRFLFERVLGVAETPTPEDELEMSPVERGNLVHLALERFLAEVPARTSPAQPWSADERARLEAILDELFADAERRGVTGRPLLWRGQRRRLRRDVLGLLDRDEARRRAAGVVPVAGELSFGLDAEGLPPVDVLTSTGRKVAFRGRIDRVDLAPDGSHMVVVDYKSGSPYSYTGLEVDPVQAGRLVQLPLYALAAQLRYGEVPTQAAYWFVGERADYKWVPVSLDRRTTQRLHEVVDATGDGVDAGVFPANPGGRGGRTGHRHCTFCPYDRVCPRDRQAAWERVHDDDAIEPYRRLGGGS